MTRTNSIIIGVTGGSCSGKTTLVSYACEALGRDHCNIVSQDNYYRGLESSSDCATVNFDHPEAVDFTLLREHVGKLKAGESIAMPIYNFETHRRLTERILVHPKRMIVLEGILILWDSGIRKLLDATVFVECTERVRFARRLFRDQSERGRSKPEILQQYRRQVAPMHNRYVQPSKAYADVVLSQNDCLNEIEGKSTCFLDTCVKLLEKTVPI